MTLADDAETERILRDRARELARPATPPAPAGSTLELLEFGLAKERYALETRHVQEVHPLRELTPLPGTPPFLLGIVNVRGRIVPVLDLKKFFELPEQGLTDLHRVILVHGDDIELGVLADSTHGVHDVTAATLQPSLPTLTGIRAQYLLGVTAARVVVLDFDRVLSDPSIIVRQDVD
jgi:purine-binding chemotaxis protein CheW